MNMYKFFSIQILSLEFRQHVHGEYLSLQQKLAAIAEISSQPIKHSVDVVKKNKSGVGCSNVVPSLQLQSDELVLLALTKSRQKQNKLLGKTN